jgi:light-regulated signal transduction histidine kinase (bacteriophytochrome)
LSALARSVAEQLKRHDPQRQAEFAIREDAVVTGDSTLLRVVIDNLLGNAWKYTSSRTRARIEFGWCEESGERVYFVKDNGVGFDPASAARLFQPFHRLHTAADFPGTGIGLATVQRIIRRNGGRIWAQSAVGQGAAFYFTWQEGKSLQNSAGAGL